MNATIDSTPVSTGSPDWVVPRELEHTEVHEVGEITSGVQKTIGNLPWLVAAARDCGTGVYPPRFIIAKY